VHLKSLTLKGFKSFPDRTRLDFGPGVSVVVGPNGSGKSNVTDAVLWAMGEQSPLAVRGQSMQDVIFGGGRGVQARSSAEVELVLDNSDGTVALPLSEISILRRLHRSGEGEYRLNGARCRLGDVIEVLSDTGLGKETHSVISQGRVEAIVTSKPRDRRLLIEEAAGLGKHRKRRRRAQLKLERTQENLDRALDVEREARSHLRPLKRQAEAAELHQRLERQMLETRLELAREALRARRLQLGEAETAVQEARAAREEVEGGLQEIVERRSLAERALAERSQRHDDLAQRALHAGAAGERLELRREHAAATAENLAERSMRTQREIEVLEEALSGAADPARLARADAEGEEAADGSQAEQDRSEIGQRVAALEHELAELEREREQELERELAELEREREQAAAEVAELDATLAEAREGRAQADALAGEARSELREVERAVEAARREAARVGSELAAVNQFLRNHALPAAALAAATGGSPETQPGESRPEDGGVEDARTLSEALRVQPGYELALAAALGRRLDASLVPDLAHAAALLDRAGPDGATALLADRRALEEAPARTLALPAPGARLLAELVDGPHPVLALAQRLLTDVWVLERLEDLPEDFAGIAVTPRGRAWFAASGEVRQITEGGSERVLARRNEREQLILAAERAATAEHAARGAAERAHEESHAADSARVEAEDALREVARDHAHALEQERHAAWLIEQRRATPEQGPLAVRRAQLEGELAAERRQAERIAREHAERLQRLQRLRAQHAADTDLQPLAARLAAALQSAGEAVAARVAELQSELERDRAAGEEMAVELRACAAQEAEIQARLRAEGEAVTTAEVAAQRLRDQATEAAFELRTVREQLELPEPSTAPVAEDEASEEGATHGGPATVEGDTMAHGGPVMVEGDTMAHGGPATLDGDTATHGDSAPLDGDAAASLNGDSMALDRDSAAIAGQYVALDPDFAAFDEDSAEREEDPEPLSAEQVQALAARLERLRRRREQLGPVNPLAKEEYAEALAHVEELEARRTDLETALRELRTVIRDTDRQIHETFHATFEAAAANFEELSRDVFPGGGGRLRLVKDTHGPRPVLGGQPLSGEDAAPAAEGEDAEAAAEQEEGSALDPAHPGEEELLGVEIEITPAGKSAKRLTLLSGGEKSMTALAFLFAVFLARPCPFYILDEVEAALDDLNLDRFLSLLRRYANRAQFIVITHQKRTMEAADCLYGVSMAGNGVSKVLSRRLPAAERTPEQMPAQAEQVPIQTEQTQALAGQAPALIEQTPAQAEQVPTQTEQTLALAEQMSAETEQTLGLAEQVPTETEQTPAQNGLALHRSQGDRQAEPTPAVESEPAPTVSAPEMAEVA
jgi:chromosome segregation protein